MKKIATTITLPYELLLRVAHYSEMHKIKRSEAVRQLIERGLNSK